MPRASPALDRMAAERADPKPIEGRRGDGRKLREARHPQRLGMRPMHGFGTRCAKRNVEILPLSARAHLANIAKIAATDFSNTLRWSPCPSPRIGSVR